MPAELTRIISDIHYGDRASRVHRLGQLRPLLDGVTALVLNGDTLDTRLGPAPAHTAACRTAVLEFFPKHVPHVTFLTGNHDPDLSPHHALDLADGRVFATHGDIFYDNVVPWGRDAARIGGLISAALAAVPPSAREDLATRLAVWRRVAASIPQRHQSERRRLKYALHYAVDTVWPPFRVFRILQVWRTEAANAAAFLRRHRPAAKFVLLGHTHRPRVMQSAPGVIAINTGSFCPPLGTRAVDLTPDRITVRRVESRHGEFHPGAIVAEFAL